MIFGSTFPRDSAEARTVATRRAVIDQLFPWGSQGSADSPLLLAWSKGPVLDVDLPGDVPNRVGEGLFMIPLAMTLDAQQVFSDQMIRRTVIETTADSGWGDVRGMYLSRGTMTVETRPALFDGAFQVSSLEIALTQGEARALSGSGTLVQPLPAGQQPNQDDPLAEGGPTPSAAPDASPSPAPAAPGGGGEAPGKPPIPPFPADGFSTLPDFQLFDRTAQRWVEFPQAKTTSSYLIADPERYVDESGGVLFRFVNRAEAGEFGEEQLIFQLQIRLEGIVS